MPTFRNFSMDQDTPITVPVLHPYNDVLRGKISQEDAARLVRLKKAADSVYKYFEWVASDFRRIDDSAKHSARIEELLQDVMASLMLSQFQKSLAGYFVVCVLSEIKEEFMAGGPSNTMFPVNVEALQEVAFSSEEVIDAVHQMPIHMAFYIAGIFIPENYEINDLEAMTKASIMRGAVVYSDDTLTTTDDLVSLVEAHTGKPFEEADEEDHFPAFVAALKALYEPNDGMGISSLIEES